MPAMRYPTKEKASIEIYGRSGNFIAHVSNLSVTGACLEWMQERDLSIEKGDLVRVTVVLKALNRRHNLNAEVVWKEGKKTGVSFIKSSEVLDKIMDRV
ncbi:MAG: PilZ domain-containing protein [Bdellovibrio sp. CG10_big_fil_rev_8_21_14_0_10_47_8]|nr:MAG: PilZ domain-containing protein [Bdellovibrio sp. CG10_big_fil_rev_8_21_14_0_10_47_8]